jgi:hypothetical protein
VLCLPVESLHLLHQQWLVLKSLLHFGCTYTGSTGHVRFPELSQAQMHMRCMLWCTSNPQRNRCAEQNETSQPVQPECQGK